MRMVVKSFDSRRYNTAILVGLLNEKFDGMGIFVIGPHPITNKDSIFWDIELNHIIQIPSDTHIKISSFIDEYIIGIENK